MTNLIVAVAKNGVIGINNQLPWKISEDLRNFKKLTMGGVVVVGKNTAKSLPMLPGRDVIVLETGKTSFSDVKSKYANREIWIAGGAKVYETALSCDICDKAYITIIDREFDGDTYFPINEVMSNKKWKLMAEEALRQADPVVKLFIFNREVIQ